MTHIIFVIQKKLELYCTVLIFFSLSRGLFSVRKDPCAIFRQDVYI